MIEEEKQPQNPSYASDEAVRSEIPSGLSSHENVVAAEGLEPERLSSERDGELYGDGLSSAIADEAQPDVMGSTSAEAIGLEALKREVEDLKARLEAGAAQGETFKSQSIRIAADFDNYRKRTAKEKEDLEVQVKCSTLGELLQVVDNFERARSAIKPKTEAEMNIQKGYHSVYKQLVEALKRLGVSPMRPEGKEFDPNLHEAVMREPTEEYSEGTVMEELVRGYFLGDRVLRHAMVKVAAIPTPVVTSEGTQHDTSNG